MRLLKATLLHNSHVAPRGSSLVAFKSVAEIFNDRAGTTEGSDGEDNISTNVSPKTLYESFRKLFKYFRVDDKKYRSMSGIEQEFSEKDTLLSDICCAQDDMVESQCKIV